MPTASRHNTWIVTLSLAVLAVGFLAFLWLPGRRQIRQLAEQIETKRTVVAQATNLGATKLAIHLELGQAEAFVERWEKAAPAKGDIPALFGKINALARSNHLSIRRFDPQPAVLREQLAEIPITMNCSGRFGQVFEFLRSLEDLPPTIWVESLRIEKEAQDAKDVQCELNLVVFSNNSQGSDYTKAAD